MRKKWTPEELISFEDRIGELYLDNKLPFLFHLSGGNETQLIDIFENIKEGDYVISNHRSHYHALLHGIPPETVEDRILNGRSMFIYDRERNFFCSAIIGGTPAIAAGIAWALKRKGSSQRVWCFIGDGTEDSGHTYEAVRYVDGFDLPCTFVIENNNRSVESTNDESLSKNLVNPGPWLSANCLTLPCMMPVDSKLSPGGNDPEYNSYMTLFPYNRLSASTFIVLG